MKAGSIFKCQYLPRLVIVFLLALILAISCACSKESLNGSSPAVAATPVIPSGPESPAADPNLLLNVRRMAADAGSYAITYGPLDVATIQNFKTYPLVIVHPYNGNITRSQIMQIKQGVDPADPRDNVVVLCYVSIGEDERTFNLSNQQMLADPRFRGDGSGPSIDPRGAGASGSSLVGLDPKGTPTGGGYASFYLNDNAVACQGVVDRKPDLNGNFLTRFVNAGDPAWYATVNLMQMNANTHTPPGLMEMLTADYGRGLGCDGVFLDTIDTAAPNSYTTCSDVNHSKSEWTAKGYSDFIRRLRAEYPDKVILQNRGLFYFDPRWPQYEVSARGAVDIAFFESYYQGNDSATVSAYFPDNKYNIAPKLMAEANRPDGFKVLSLGYADGFSRPKPNINIQTLLGQSQLGLNDLLTDMQEAMSVGFRHYITSASINFVNSFVKDHAVLADSTPPQWTSVYNANYNIIAAPQPRIGIQSAARDAAGSVKVAWDVALDLNRVSYILYYKTAPFDFALDPRLTSATRVVLSAAVGDDYALVWNKPVPSQALQTVYPYKASITGLQQGVLHYFVIRAIDSAGNEDANQVVLTATP